MSRLMGTKKRVTIFRRKMMANYLVKIILVLSTLFLSTQSVMSAENKSGDSKKVAPLVIQSQVKGSQEQPNVIYIMPWQGVDKVIEVKGKVRTIKLPHFKPINPKVFKEQVRLFANKKLTVGPETDK